jgi:hypothetical protein
MIQYSWTPAAGNDVPEIVQMAQSHFQTEIDTVFQPDPVAYSRNITFAVVNQFYLPGSELIYIARDASGKLVAYTWAKSNERAAWSDDNMITIRMAHVDLSLSARDRLRLISDMMTIWEQFARSTNTPIICSTTMRKDQDAFLRLHARNGYDVRGSYAYKKLSA